MCSDVTTSCVIVMNKNVRVLLRILIGIVLIVSSGMAYYFGTKTLVDLWIPWSVSFSLALLSGIFAWRIWIPLTSAKRFIINFPIHLIGVTVIFGFLILAINYTLSDIRTRTVVNAEVCSRYTKTRYHTKRVGRHYTAKGNPYKVYYIEIEFPDGRKKESGVTLSQYNRIKKGTQLRVVVENGFLSMPVMKELNNPHMLSHPYRER